MPRPLLLSFGLTLAALGTTHAQNVRVVATQTTQAHGVGIGIGVNWMAARCPENELQLQFPANAPTPPRAGPTRGPAGSVIVSPNQVIRVIMKTQPGSNLNPLEVQFTCENKQVKVEAGRLVNLIRR